RSATAAAIAAAGPSSDRTGARGSRTRRAPPPTAARCRIAGVIPSIRRSVGVALDPDHRKDDDARRFGIGVDVAAASERTVSLWKLHDDSHAPLRGHRHGLLP